MRLSFAALIAFTVSLNTLAHARYQEDIFERDVMDLSNTRLEQRDILSAMSTREIVRELERRGNERESCPTCHSRVPRGTVGQAQLLRRHRYSYGSLVHEEVVRHRPALAQDAQYDVGHNHEVEEGDSAC
ncbi:hypothetical protein DFP72DRAFT_851486 [Ephemerocybe angulata]|uniref:Uncharacterized protein n=1 Tax=Ephemerocybe angulata TaxID=980116 RepID=A0A8H6HQ67_9AGAR|nr:hypothetical protein DFP72DRAFT_851486 [Tulosesus angulatus]